MSPRRELVYIQDAPKSSAPQMQHLLCCSRKRFASEAESSGHSPVSSPAHLSLSSAR